MKKGGMLILVLGMILREARTKMNLTLEALSKLTNISIAELSNLEKIRFINILESYIKTNTIILEAIWFNVAIKFKDFVF